MNYCRDCRFFRTDARFLTTCHRYAPRLDAILMTDPDLHERTHFAAKWPEVPAGEWCGEFAPVVEECTSEPRAQVPAELQAPPVESPKPLAKLPTAKAAVELVFDYLSLVICDYDESELIVDKQIRETREPGDGIWRIEAHYGAIDYVFFVGPDGIVTML